MTKEQGPIFSESEFALFLQDLNSDQMRRALTMSIENPKTARAGFVFKSNNEFFLDPEAEQASLVFDKNTGMFIFIQGEEPEEVEEPRPSYFDLTRFPTIRIALDVAGVRAFNEKSVLGSIFLSECNYRLLTGNVELDNIGAEPTVIHLLPNTAILTVGKGAEPKDEKDAKKWFRDMTSYILTSEV